jgi:hypothetical protein
MEFVVTWLISWSVGAPILFCLSLRPSRRKAVPVSSTDQGGGKRRGLEIIFVDSANLDVSAAAELRCWTSAHWN